MPSYLGEYEGGATDRGKKFIRAVDSYIYQSPHNIKKELIIVSDGCPDTINIYNNTNRWHKNTYSIKLIEIPKSELFSGEVRQKAIENATGDIICYLDTDDFFGNWHLLNILSAFQNGVDWIYFNYYQYWGKTISAVVFNTQLKHEQIGTSAIAHKRLLNVSWTGCNGYGHDWQFIEQLLKYSSHIKTYGCEYFVGHVKGVTDY